MTDPVFSSV